VSGRGRRAVAPPRWSAAYAGVVAGTVVVIGVFLPWYTTNLGAPFSPASVSGWDSTNFARAAVIAAAVATIAAAALALEERGSLELEPQTGEALAWTVIGGFALALVVVGYRLLVLPEPADLLSRQIGIYLATVAAVVGVVSGLGLLATRR
jgi:hypothetical protein